MNLLGKVRRLYYRDRLTLSKIERRTGLTRKTIRKWLTAPEGVEPKYRSRSGSQTVPLWATVGRLRGWGDFVVCTLKLPGGGWKTENLAI